MSSHSLKIVAIFVLLLTVLVLVINLGYGDIFLKRSPLTNISPEVKNTRMLSIMEVDDMYLKSRVPVIISACSANHYKQCQGLFKSIKEDLFPKYGNMTVVFYDLGLTAKQRKHMENTYKFQIRTFNFSKYPEYFKHLFKYSWKPVLVHNMLKEFEFIMWVDCSIRFNDKPPHLDPIIENTLNPDTPVQVIKGGASIYTRTRLYTFQALAEDPERYKTRPEIGSGWVFIRRGKVAEEHIIGPWADCALRLGCQTTVSEVHPELCADEKDPSVLIPYGCHRFDQSTLGIILNRYHHGDYDKFSFNYTLFGDIIR